MVNNSSKILITGADGFVGRHLSALLSEEGNDFIAVSRNPNIGLLSNNLYLVKELSVTTCWTDALKNIDVVVHLAARVHVMAETAYDPLSAFREVNVAGTLNLARQAAEIGVKRFIFISTAKVNGEYTQPFEAFTENDQPNPDGAYAISKFEAEQGLEEVARETGMEVVIIRPPLIYGPGVKANFASMINAVKRGIPLPLGAINNQRSFVYVGNLVDLIAHCIKHPAAANQVFMVSDGVDVSTTTLLRVCAKALGIKSRLIPVPQKILELLLKLIGKNRIAQRLCGNLQLDISKAHQLLGWSPPYSMDEGLKNTVTKEITTP